MTTSNVSTRVIEPVTNSNTELLLRVETNTHIPIGCNPQNTQHMLNQLTNTDTKRCERCKTQYNQYEYIMPDDIKGLLRDAKTEHTGLCKPCRAHIFPKQQVTQTSNITPKRTLTLQDHIRITAVTINETLKKALQKRALPTKTNGKQ